MKPKRAQTIKQTKDRNKWEEGCSKQWPQHQAWSLAVNLNKFIMSNNGLKFIQKRMKFAF